jgi:hypothetical protein
MGDIFFKYIKVILFCVAVLIFTAVMSFGMYMTNSLLATVQIMIGFLMLPFTLILIYLSITFIMEQIKNRNV